MPSASPGTECARVRAIGRLICDDRREDDGEKGNAEAEDKKNGRDEVCVMESLPLHDTCQYVLRMILKSQVRHTMGTEATARYPRLNSATTMPHPRIA